MNNVIQLTDFRAIPDQSRKYSEDGDASPRHKHASPPRASQSSPRRQTSSSSTLDIPLVPLDLADDDQPGDFYEPTSLNIVHLELGRAIRQTKLICKSFIATSTIKIILMLGRLVWGFDCSSPLQIWLEFMTGYDLLYLLHNWSIIHYIPKTSMRFLLMNYDPTDPEHQDTNLSGFFIGQCLQQYQPINGVQIMSSCEHYFKCIGSMAELLRIFYIMLFIFGNIFLYIGLDTFDGFDNIVFMVYLALGYCYLIIPLLLCVSWPCLIVGIFCVQFNQNNQITREQARSRQKPIQKNFIKKHLKAKNYSQVMMEEHTEEVCTICYMEYDERQSVIQLPCNVAHYFHQECCEKWLNINGTCPILTLVVLVVVAQTQKFVLVGGDLQDDNEVIYGKLVEMATNPHTGQQYIGVVTAASPSAQQAQQEAMKYMEILSNFGATKVEWIPLHIDNPQLAYDDEWLTKVDSMTGILLADGEASHLTQLLLTNTQEDVNMHHQNYEQTPLLSLMRSNVALNRTVLAGISAGTTILQRTPIASRTTTSHQALRQVSSPPTEGFGLLALNIYIDTNFKLGRQGTLISLIHDLQHQTGVLQGAGIDERTALVLDGTHATIVGEGGVSFFDLRAAHGSRQVGGLLSIENVTLTYLTSGDEFDVSTYEMIRFDCGKTHINGHETHALPMDVVQDVFGQFTAVAQDLLDSKSVNTTQGYTSESDPLFQVDFIKTQQTRGYYDLEDRNVLSILKMIIEIHPLTATSS